MILKAQPITDALALHAIGLISGNLRQAWSNGDNIEARTAMMNGALEAGLAFSSASKEMLHMAIKYKVSIESWVTGNH